MYTAFFWQEDAPPLANGALCLSTPKHNGKSGTEVEDGRRARNKYKHTSTHIIYH